MGPQINKNRPSITSDEQISSLKSEIQVHIARTSLMQTRLLQTLDALDALKNSNAQELATEIQEKEILQRRLEAEIRRRRAAERDRDDHRDAVCQLIEKVELANGDFKLLPHSSIQMTTVVEPLPDASTSHITKSTQEFGYISSIIASLCLERDAERSAHNRTREDAEALIATLQAQLARREAQLEAIAGGSSTDVDLQRDITDPSSLPSKRRYARSNKRTDGPHDGSQYSPLDFKESERVLEAARARRLALEAEVKGLLHYLETSRKRTEYQPPGDSVPSVNDAQASAGLPADGKTPPSNISLPRLRASGSNSNSTAHPEPLSAMKYLDNQINDLASQIEAFRIERNLLLETLGRQSKINNEASPHGVSPKRLLAQPAMMGDLDDQTMAFASQIDDFGPERQLLKQALGRDREEQVPTYADDEKFHPLQNSKEPPPESQSPRQSEAQRIVEKLRDDNVVLKNQIEDMEIEKQRLHDILQALRNNESSRPLQDEQHLNVLRTATSTNPEEEVVDNSVSQSDTINATNVNRRVQRGGRDVINELQNQISALITQINAFQLERKLLSETLEKERKNHENTPPCVSDQANMTLLSADCSLEEPEEGRDLLDCDEEESMILATPLHPISMLPTTSWHADHSTESPYIDPPSIPLPDSPMSSTHSPFD